MATPAYPEVVVNLDGEPHDVFNRVVRALREADVPPERRVVFIVAAIATKEPARVARLWVTEGGTDGEAAHSAQGTA